MVHICFTNAKSLVATIVPGENTRYVQANQMTVTATKKMPETANIKIASDQIEMAPPEVDVTMDILVNPALEHL